MRSNKSNACQVISQQFATNNYEKPKQDDKFQTLTSSQTWKPSSATTPKPNQKSNRQSHPTFVNTAIKGCWLDGLLAGCMAGLLWIWMNAFGSCIHPFILATCIRSNPSSNLILLLDLKYLFLINYFVVAAGKLLNGMTLYGRMKPTKICNF